MCMHVSIHGSHVHKSTVCLITLQSTHCLRPTLSLCFFPFSTCILLLITFSSLIFICIKITGFLGHWRIYRFLVKVTLGSDKKVCVHVSGCIETALPYLSALLVSCRMPATECAGNGEWLNKYLCVCCIRMETAVLRRGIMPLGERG